MKSKYIAAVIFILVYAFPFRIAFLSDEIADSSRFIIALLGTIFGFLIAFGIGTNEPFDRKPKTKEVASSTDQEYRKAA
ncbi:MAG TPA: hypothetical protein VL651_12505 [Bacteroidia bacterium]|jgi:hypothetical protein|nr:hypothetical protein [Bacteroidia bacterium]